MQKVTNSRQTGKHILQFKWMFVYVAGWIVAIVA